MASVDDRIRRLLSDHGRTYAEEIGIDLSKNTPAPLFQWLVASILLSARIGANLAIAAAKGLIAEGLTTPEHMRDAGWERRTRILNQSGYARYDESTSRMLGDTSDLLLDRYGGDLRRLCEEAGGEADEVRRRLQDFKGIGEVGADIFCRDVQAAWPGLYPFADERALEIAERLGLPKTTKGLSAHVSRIDFPRLLAALIRVSLAGEEERYGG